jgi:hypothetical protein
MLTEMERAKMEAVEAAAEFRFYARIEGRLTADEFRRKKAAERRMDNAYRRLDRLRRKS